MANEKMADNEKAKRLLANLEAMKVAGSTINTTKDVISTAYQLGHDLQWEVSDDSEPGLRVIKTKLEKISIDFDFGIAKLVLAFPSMEATNPLKVCRIASGLQFLRDIGAPHLQHSESFDLAMYTYLVQCHPSNDSMTTKHPARHWWWEIANGSNQKYEEYLLLVGKGEDQVNDETLDKDTTQYFKGLSVKSDTDDFEEDCSAWQVRVIRLVRTGDDHEEFPLMMEAEYNEERISYIQFVAGEDETMWNKRKLENCLSQQVRVQGLLVVTKLKELCMLAVSSNNMSGIIEWDLIGKYGQLVTSHCHKSKKSHTRSFSWSSFARLPSFPGVAKDTKE